MNTKTIAIIVILVLLLGAGYLLLGKQGINTSMKNTQTLPTNTPVPEEETEAMIENQQDIAIMTDGFDPVTVTVKVGTKVVWTNKTGAVATVNSDLHPTHLLNPFLNLGRVENTASVSVIFDKAGTYKYHDHLNPSRTGTVVVE